MYVNSDNIFKQFKIYCKQMSKTVSTRLQNDIYEKLLNTCNNKGITVNEFLKQCISNSFDDSELKIEKVSEQVLSEKDLAKILGINQKRG